MLSSGQIVCRQINSRDDSVSFVNIKINWKHILLSVVKLVREIIYNTNRAKFKETNTRQKQKEP